MDPITRCHACSKDIFIDCISDVMDIPEDTRKLAVWRCPRCRTRGTLAYGKAEFLQMMKVWKEHKANESIGVDAPSSAAIGKKVAGFQIDLAGIDSVEDIQLYWNSEAPREGADVCVCESCISARRFK